jgi:hypothetical protein
MRYLTAWRDTMLKRPSVVNTLSEKQYYEEIYGRYLRVSSSSFIPPLSSASSHRLICLANGIQSALAPSGQSC